MLTLALIAAANRSDSFREACEKENIIPNIKPNPRNSVNKEAELSPIGTVIFDQLLYKDRTVVEHANAWIDGFKALLVRFEFSVRNWMSLHFMAFSIIFFRKISKKKESLNRFHIKRLEEIHRKQYIFFSPKLTKNHQ